MEGGSVPDLLVMVPTRGRPAQCERLGPGHQLLDAARQERVGELNAARKRCSDEKGAGDG